MKRWPDAVRTDPEKKRLKRIRELEYGRFKAHKQRVIGERFREFTRHQRVWLKEITEKYMERGVWPATPMLVLPSYYTDRRDKEVALFLSVLMPEDNVMDSVAEMRAVIGEHPWEWFAERRYVSLSLGTVMNGRTAGVTNWKFARLMDRLWDDNPPETFFAPVHDMAVWHLADGQPYYEALRELYEGLGVGQPAYRLRLLLLILLTADGFGLGLWPVDTEEAQCPLTDDVRLFLETWFPDAKQFGGFDKCVHEFGFGKDHLFYYAYLGYRALCRVEPEKCSYLTSRFQRWYLRDTPFMKWQWTQMLPEIRFD